AEAWVTVRIGRCPVGNIASRRFDSIMMALFCGLRVGRRRWRRRVKRGRLRMGATRQRKGKKQYCRREQFLHDVSFLRKQTRIGEQLLRAQPTKGHRCDYGK